MNKIGLRPSRFTYDGFIKCVLAGKGVAHAVKVVWYRVYDIFTYMKGYILFNMVVYSNYFLKPCMKGYLIWLFNIDMLYLHLHKSNMLY
jgi:hypothetical protein